MIHPIEMNVDLDAEAGYVQYLPDDVEVAGTLDVWEDGQVAADLDAVGGVIGIEVLGLDEETLGHARRFAHDRGLAFPVDLAQAVAVA